MTVYTTPRADHARPWSSRSPDSVARTRVPSTSARCQPGSVRGRSPRCMKTETIDKPSEYRASSTGPDGVTVLVTPARVRLPASLLGTGQPRGRDVGAPRLPLGGRHEANALVTDLQVDECSLADSASALVEYLPAQREAGVLVKPVPRGERAVVPPH